MGAAALFGASTPFAKQLLPSVGPVPWPDCSISPGLGLATYRIAPKERSETEARLTRRDLLGLTAAIVCGGVIGPCC
jgi:hypothetical protein